MYLIVLGLVFDIIGIYLVMRGPIRRSAVALREFGLPAPGRFSRLKQFTYRLYKLLYPKDMQLTQEFTEDTLFINFWGLVLLIIGFVLQAFGTLGY